MQTNSVQDPAVANFLQQQASPGMTVKPISGEPAAHELIQLSTLIRMESTGVLHAQSSASSAKDPELQQLLQSCAQTGQAHLKALMTWCSAHNVGQTGGLQ